MMKFLTGKPTRDDLVVIRDNARAYCVRLQGSFPAIICEHNSERQKKIRDAVVALHGELRTLIMSAQEAGLVNQHQMVRDSTGWPGKKPNIHVVSTDQGYDIYVVKQNCRRPPKRNSFAERFQCAARYVENCANKALHDMDQQGIKWQFYEPEFA